MFTTTLILIYFDFEIEIFIKIDALDYMIIDVLS